MRAIALVSCLFSLAVIVVADDASFCSGQCNKQFTESKQSEEKTACLSGCTHRGKVSDGARGFIQCHNACADIYNKTSDEKEDDPLRGACDFACSLPMSNVFMMKVDYGMGDAQPKIQVMQKEGTDLFSSSEEFPSDLEKLLLHPDSVNVAFDNDEKKEKKEGNIQDSNWPVPAGGALSNMFKFKTGDEELDRMQDRMNDLVRSFFSRANAHFNIAVERPSGHDAISMNGKSVDNEDEDGRQILFVAPIGSDKNGWIDMDELDRPRESSLRHRFPSLLQWTVCLVLLLAVACTLLVALLMARHLRLHRYSALRIPSAGTVVNAPPMDLKKVPIDKDDSSLPEPSGVPPPAYDQLSVHSKHTLPY